MKAAPECMQCGRVRGVRWRVRLREYVCSLCGNTWKPLEAKRQADAKDTLELAVELERLEVAEERREEAEALAKVAKIQAEESADPDALGVQSDAEPDALGVGADADFDSPRAPNALGVELDRELEPDALGVEERTVSPSVPDTLGVDSTVETEPPVSPTDFVENVEAVRGQRRSEHSPSDRIRRKWGVR